MFQAAHGIAKFGALDRLDQEFVGAGAHAGDDGFAIGVKVARDHEEIWSGLFDLLDGFDGAFGIGRDIDQQAGRGIPFQVLENADVEIGGYLLILAHHFGIRHVEQAVADHFTEMFVARCDQQSGIRHSFICT